MTCAAVVHGVTAVVAALGLYLIVAHWLSIPATLGGAFLLLVAWVLRPRLDPAPDSLVTRAQCPKAHALIDEVAAKLSSKPIDYLVIGEDFNASYAQVGLRGRRVLTIGLPLWAILTPQERVCLIGHELAHGINGDPLRGMIIHSTIQTLLAWANLLLPDRFFQHNPDDGLAGLLGAVGMIPVNIALWLIVQGLLAWTRVLVMLIWRESQEAEYLADRLGAEIGGADAFISMLGKLSAGQYLPLVVRKVGHGKATPGKTVIFEFACFIEGLPDSEKERLRRLTERESFRSDATHPPNRFRQALLRQATRTPRHILDDSMSRDIDAEFQPFEKALERHLVEAAFPDGVPVQYRR